MESTMKTAAGPFSLLLVGLIFLLPLFFLPVTTEYFFFNKLTLLFVAAGIFILLWAWQIFTTKTLAFHRTPLDLPVALFAMVYLTVTLIASPNRTEALLASGETSAILALTVLYFSITNNLTAAAFRQIITASLASASLLSVVAILAFAGTFSFAPAWMQNQLFSPAGGPLPLLIFLGFNLVLGLTLFLKRTEDKNRLKIILPLGASLLIALGTVFTYYQIRPGQSNVLTLPPFRSGWEIAIESFKQNPLWGTGPGNYLSAFTRFRPATFNQQNYWSARFNFAPNYPLHLLTTGGILLLGTYLLILTRTLILFRRREKRATETPEEESLLILGLATVFLVHSLLPVNLIVLTIFYCLLAFFSLTGKSHTVRFPSQTFSATLLGSVILLIIAGGYLWGRVYLSDYHFRLSLTALAKGDGLSTYNEQVKAISLLPQLPVYRRAYSQTSLALANSLASQGENLSDQDRTSLTTLVQQAVNEAKAATTLNPTDVTNWENLAGVYRNLLHFAQGADQWTIAAYQQAIATDPVNPALRIELGGIFYGLRLYDNAADLFKTAVNLKPDFPNAYYNLAATYREQAKYAEAYNALKATANLIPADSTDHQKVMEELEQLKSKLPTTAEGTQPPATQESQLSEPEPLPSPVLEPPLDLPEELRPETEADPEAPEKTTTEPPASPRPSTP